MHHSAKITKIGGTMHMRIPDDRSRSLSRRVFGTGAAAGVLAGVLGPTDAVAAVPAPATANRFSDPVQQLRGTWIATVDNYDWPTDPDMSPRQQQEELIGLLETAVEYRLNAVMFQVRPTGDALWPSKYEPWAEVLTGKQGRDPGWDPLDFAIREAHRRGLQLHAWFNPYRVANHTDPERLSEHHPARRYPEWVVPYGGKLYYNPGLPDVRSFVQDAMLDAVENYDVDAVHWDDYFYPYPVKGARFDDDDAYGEFGRNFGSRAAWRRDNTNRLVQEMAQRVRAAKPGLPFGISPFGVWRSAENDPDGSDTGASTQSYDDLYADTRKWVREGWIDYIVPQLYWNIGFAAADYAKLVPWWSEVVKGTGVHLYAGEALYKVGDRAQPAAWQDPAELSRHLTLGKRYPQVRGNVFFSAKVVRADPLGAMSRVVRDHFDQPAKPPRRS
jgi:uncharacterized lipoprotein YddW (UPF0748 family)